MKLLSFLLIASLQQLGSCDSSQPAKPAENAVVATTPRCSTDHRFERLEIYPYNLRADIALDSCTGQVCRTWEWHIKPGVTNAWKPYETAPLCGDLTASRP